MPTMTASTGNFSVSGVMRALEPWTMRTISPWPAPTVSTTTNVRPVETSLSRLAGSTRSGSTVRSLRPVMELIFCVATTLPVTLARNMVASLGKQCLRLPGDDQLFIGRHDPDLHAAARSVNGRLALRLIVSCRVQHNAKPVKIGTNRRAHACRGFADAPPEVAVDGAVQQAPL